MVAAVAHRRLGDEARAGDALSDYLERSPFTSVARLRDRYGRSRAPRYREMAERMFDDLAALGMPER